MHPMLSRIDRPTLVAFGVVAVGALFAAVPGSATSDGPDSGPVAQLSVPDWMEVDRDASTVTLEITAGAAETNNYWNFNGYTNGEARIVVPEGFEVEIRFSNDDPNMAHSLGIDEARRTWPAMIPDPEPAFEGALTTAPTSMTESTQPGESETITFTAGQAGEYAMVCYVPGHATVGMWIYFVVSAEGEAGVRTSG